jgi:hypothetical protein
MSIYLNGITKSCTEHELPRISPTKLSALVQFQCLTREFWQGKGTDTDRLYSQMNIESLTIFLVFYHHSLECHKYIRITLFWVKLKFQSDQHVCAVRS